MYQKTRRFSGLLGISTNRRVPAPTDKIIKIEQDAKEKKSRPSKRKAPSKKETSVHTPNDNKDSKDTE